jgi:two-component system, OmpR family, sensor kinase
MSQASIRRHLMVWVLGALILVAPLIVLATYLLTLDEIDELLNASLRQTALLLADRDLAHALPVEPFTHAGVTATTEPESMLVAIARRPDGTLLFSSQPEVSLHFEATPGASVQRANDAQWHVFTVVQHDRVVQVAQPTSARREVAAESATQLVLPLVVLIALIGVVLVVALRRGVRPLGVVNDALAQRSATSLEPLEVREVPVEILPLVLTLNDLLRRLRTAFEAQHHFAADAAHELRSPVTALQLQVQILERSSDPAERAEATAELSAGIARARRLIEKLLSLSQADADADTCGAPVREPVSLGELARSVVVRWSAQAEQRGIDLGADAETDATVVGDAALLESLLSNLVENALRYSGPGSVVDVVAGRFDGAPTLRVIDDGPGIAQGERQRVFDRFYRSPLAEASAEPGSGLGLAIVKAIADRQRAVVTLHAGRDGKGLEVRVTFTPSQA